MDLRSYHLMELAIARDPADPRRRMPPIAPHHRRVLDIGCGAGQTLIASALPPGALRVGIDIDPEAIALGRELDPALHLLRARGEALPFGDTSFDLVICRVALPYMHIGRAIGEMARVLAPGGDVWLVLHPWQMTAGELAGAVRRGHVRAALHRAYVTANSILFHLAGAQLPWPPTGRYESFQTEHGVRRALGAAGFRHIAFERRRGFIATAQRL
jgi:ubiquinone/menaquinone biosynthesis C-methylase UbiE